MKRISNRPLKPYGNKFDQLDQRNAAIKRNHGTSDAIDAEIRQLRRGREQIQTNCHPLFSSSCYLEEPGEITLEQLNQFNEQTNYTVAYVQPVIVFNPENHT